MNSLAYKKPRRRTGKKPTRFDDTLAAAVTAVLVFVAGMIYTNWDWFLAGI